MYSFSLIVPCYNPDLKQFDQCIRSIKKAKKNQAVQVIVTCNGNDLKTEDYCRKLMEEDPDFSVYFGPTKGVSQSRNIGMEKAKSDYILFCDCDDSVKENIFKEITQAAVKNQEPDIILYGFDKISPQETESILPYEQEDYTAIIARENGQGLCWNKAYKTSFLKENDLKFNENLVLAEDIEFELRIAGKNPSYAILKKPLHNYFIHQNSVSQRFRWDMQDEYLKSMQAIYDNKNIDLEYKRDVAMDHLIFTVMKYSFRKEKGSYKENKKELKKLMEIPIYKDALSNAKMENAGSAKKLVQFLLKARLFYPVYQMSCLYQKRAG